MASHQPAVSLRSAPTIILWDLVGSCNLKCPSCPMGSMRGSNDMGFIADDLFHAVLDKLKRDFGGAEAGVGGCRQLHFYNWTEPLLHPKIVAHCRAAANAGFHVHLSSNLNHLPDADGIIRSGIKTLRISLSGFTQETYRIGHRGGTIEKVKTNMRRLSEALAACGLARPPRVHVYFHKYRHNLHEIAPMESLARELGFDFLSDWAFLMPLEKLLAYEEGSLDEDERTFANERLAPPPGVALKVVRSAGGCNKPCELIEQLVLDHRGRAMLCCATFDNRSNVIGDYMEIDWQALQAKRSMHSMCTRCTAAGAHAFYTHVSDAKLRERMHRLAEQSCSETTTNGRARGDGLTSTLDRIEQSVNGPAEDRMSVMPARVARTRVGVAPKAVAGVDAIASSDAQLTASHGLFRGGYAAVILCGRRDVLGEIAGEATALIDRKFVRIDDSLPAAEDFARSTGATLPAWPEGGLRPIPGACFVFTNAQHPGIGSLSDRGAIAGEHFVIALEARSVNACDAARMRQELSAFVREEMRGGPTSAIGILGYGDQGRRVVQCLCDDIGVARKRLMVCDSNAQSAARAERDGLRIESQATIVEHSDGVIATPLARFESIGEIVRQARGAGKPVFDNARQSIGLRQWRQRGNVWMDEAAERCLRVAHGASATVSLRESALPPSTFIVREETRRFGRIEVNCLLSGQSHDFALADSVDLAVHWHRDGLASTTYGGLKRAFVSLRNRADAGFFAAREMCMAIWPQTTATIFPSEHASDLGATAFERMLRAHLDAREIVSTMQTPAQRVTLGAAAAHFAASRPIVEIGSALGGSALLMATATDVHRPKIVSIDPDAPTRDIMRRAFDREGHGDRLQQVVSSSDDAIQSLQHLEGRCGLAFIDGLHTVEAVVNDFRNYAPLIAAGGAIVFHDVCPAIHSVMQAVCEHVLIDRRFEARCLVDGLLVLERIAK